jgi:hypothetical protein
VLGPLSFPLKSKEEYQACTQQIILLASWKISDGIQYGIPELYILGNQQPSMVVCIGSRQADIYRVADAMKEWERDLNGLQHPASINFCVMHWRWHLRLISF